MYQNDSREGDLCPLVSFAHVFWIGRLKEADAPIFARNEGGSDIANLLAGGRELFDRLNRSLLCCGQFFHGDSWQIPLN